MDQQQRHVSSGTTNPVLRFPTVRPLPFARLVAASRRRLFLSDCADRRSDDDGDGDGDSGECAYSRAVLVLDMVWNLAFVVVAAGVLLSTLRERPSTPLRLWLCGYAFECVLHMAFVYFEFRTGIRDSFSHTAYSIVKKLEPMNTLASSVWWIFGFYWIVVGDQALLEDSPRLYWLTVVFLAFDVFFIIFCIGMACIVFFALFCIIPIIALAYAMRIREGASEEDILSLPMYRFSQSNSLVMVDDNKKQLIKGRVDSCNGSHMSALSLHPDDSLKCIVQLLKDN
ncbi:E3 ubiquitin-protein ligase At4g11680-like isoform X2 [Glycine soja]|uniref:RING-type E3 ubiquitin transferase n=2 Tax=Glycine subgen. Soja TaxID=1462606 RepID=K7KEK0_SOYBN|nr:E3 ubiquitin-protein ligase At4g11680 isoform X2 [Glycine max]XP_028225127.1 E3 ubiquitin-protein ligase At4g11680-like isoform X2 [Glycine soja]RZC20288.1 E3 ubiquitin protein ligase RIE1 isoform B [Glycine soja]|eukprot:XP_006576759.1 E3 ubiquitin-protein ligase At4g11680 isoform X2 [Glycine max]